MLVLPLLLPLFISASLTQELPCAEPCRVDGRCHQQGQACVALGDADCQQAEICGSSGACFESEGRCVATADSCPSSRACLERGRCVLDGELCATPEERASSVEREAGMQAEVGGLLGMRVLPKAGGLDLSAAFFGGPGAEAAGLAAAGAVHDASDASRPHRRLEASAITCPPDTQRQTERDAGSYTKTWCALPDGRKKGPELLVYAGQGQRMYTEYQLDQEHGEHVITEADHRVMVRGRFELGREEGLWESWYVGGGRASRGEYHAGKKVGIWTEWLRDGSEKRCDYRDPAVPDVQCVELAD